MADLEVAVDRHIATLTLNRPAKKNAFNLAMIKVWADCLLELRHDERVRVVVVTGAGDSFCSGMDLSSAERTTPPSPIDRKRQITEQVHRVPLALDDLDKPVIAAVNGAAVGAGMDIALMCDLRMAARSARFSEGYIKVGLVPGDGGCFYLPRLVGTARALELLMTGRFVDAEEAERIGLVNHVVDDDKLMDRTYELASVIASQPPLAVQMIKRATYQSIRSDLRTSLDLISSHLAVIASTEDSQAALAAFKEGRTTEFHAR
jgi:enoyl-CoA hydratase/carnithine racemase